MKKISYTIVLFFIFMLIGPHFALAACSGVNDGSGNVCLPNPLGKDIEIPELIGNVINAVLGIVGSLALIMFIYGGFTWMTAMGAAEQVKKGRDILIWATLGLVVIFTAYSLVNFVFKGLGA